MKAQETVIPFGVKATYHYGFILAHREVVNEIVEGHTKVIELSAFKNVSAPWSANFSQPKIGFSLLYFDLANPSQLGKSYGIYPYFSFTIGKKKVSWENKFGAGIGYIEKPYNRKTNYQNLVIGSTFNSLISVNTQLNVKLNEQIKTSVGLSVIHFSNGSFTMPNLGINIVSLNMGIAYQFGEPVIKLKPKIEERDHTWNKNVTVGFGLKEIPPVEGSKYAITTTSFNVMKIRSNKNTLGAGIDFFYNSSLTKLLNQNEGYVENKTDNIRVGVTLIYSLDFGKFSTLIQGGMYLYNKETEKGILYSRYQLRYYASKRMFFNLGLKTERSIADFFEIGIGYKFS